VPPEASPSAVQHSTNSEGLSSAGPSTWNTLRVWRSWTKRESPAKAGWCAAAISRALPHSSAPSVPAWKLLAEPRQSGTGRKSLRRVARAAFERAVGADRVTRAQDVAPLQQRKGGAGH
jgi:hypothetical protein